MALSLFLRAPACTSRLFSQQMLRLASQPLTPAVTQRAIATMLSAQHATVKANGTPVINVVRSFRTSPARLSDEKPHDHAKMWVAERVVSAVLVPLVPLALLMPNKLFDALLAITITAHSFWGLEAIAVDYVRASLFGPVIPKVAIALVYLLSIATLGGLFYIITHDIGIANAVRRLWAVRSEKQA